MSEVRMKFGAVKVLLTAAVTVAALLVEVSRADDALVPAVAESKRSDSDSDDEKPEGRKPDAPQVSEAEQITRLQRSIAADEKQLAELKAELGSPDSEYHKAEKDFKEIDEKFLAEQEEIAKRKASGDESGLKRLEADHADTEKSRGLARERFDLAIQSRKNSQEQVTAIESKLVQTKAALDRMVGTEKAPPPAPAATATPKDNVESSPSPAPSGAGTQNTAPVANDAAEAPAAGAPAAAPAGTGISAAPGSQASFVGSQTAGDAARERANRDIIKAEEIAKEKQRIADRALLDATSLSERLATLDAEILLEQRQLETARKKAKLDAERREADVSDYHRKVLDDGGRQEMQAARDKVAETSKAAVESQAAVAAHMDHLQDLQADRAALQKERVAADRQSKERQVELLLAQERLTELKNPFSPRNLLQWLLDHGPRIILILVVMVVVRGLIRVSMRRVVDVMMQRGFRGTLEESEDRARTLVGVFQNAASLTVVVGGTLMVCEEAGIAVAPLMGGAAVIGLAVAFGAQNLIRDYFYGFVILLENQYKLNDVLKIGDVSGQVERITLRMTVLRDLEGSVHFIPNGKIECVTNMTHGWSRAVFEVKVAFTEDTDHVADELMQLARDLRSEQPYSRLILDEPEMLGLDALTDSAATIKFTIKTKPLKQWVVKRELLRRIRRRFSELGIVMPITEFTIKQHRAEEAAKALPHTGEDQKAA